MKNGYITILKLLTLVQFIILAICAYLIEWPIFDQNNFLVFLVAAFSFYLYIITISSLRLK